MAELNAERSQFIRAGGVGRRADVENDGDSCATLLFAERCAASQLDARVINVDKNRA